MQLLAIDGPEITAMLVSIQKTSDSELGDLARAVDIIDDEWVAGFRIGLGVNRQSE